MRWVPITEETYKWIQDYHAGIKSEWVFPGENGGHRRVKAAYLALADLFRRGGLFDSEDGSEIYSSDSMRKFAENYASLLLARQVRYGHHRPRC